MVLPGYWPAEIHSSIVQAPGPEMKPMRPNKPGAANPAMMIRFHAGSHRRGGADPDRWTLGAMKPRAGRLLFLSWCLLAALAGTMRGQNESADGPAFGGKPLSAWASEVLALGRLARVANTNHPEVQAMRAIGTNAIQWLLRELRKQPPSDGRDNQTNQEHRVTTTSPAVTTDASYRQLRARSGFWALGETAEPAIPSLLNLLVQEPDLAPSALAGIGAPALPALEQCLTNVPPHMTSNDPHTRSVASAIGSLFVAIDVGRISRAEAAYLLPTIRAWSQQKTNTTAAYWANGLLAKFNFEH